LKHSSPQDSCGDFLLFIKMIIRDHDGSCMVPTPTQLHGVWRCCFCHGYILMALYGHSVPDNPSATQVQLVENFR